MVWDIGTYELLGGSHEKGDLKLRLHGKKLKGEWHIFRIRDDAKPMWLLAKSGVAAKPLSARRDDMSALTRRSMARIAADNDAQWQSNRGAAAADASRAPAKTHARTRTPRVASRVPKRRRAQRTARAK
jgi:bifunctional non-homologous end joining protein LigD